MISVYLYKTDYFFRRTLRIEQWLRDELCRRLAERIVPVTCNALEQQVHRGLAPEVSDRLSFNLNEVDAVGLDLVADCSSELRHEGFVSSTFDTLLLNGEQYWSQEAVGAGVSVATLVERRKRDTERRLEALETFLREKSAMLKANALLAPVAAPAPAEFYEFEWGELVLEPANDLVNYEIPLPGAAPIAEEVEVPRKGLIQRLFIRDVQGVRKCMAAALKAVPPGPDGRDSRWYLDFYASRISADTLARSNQQFHAVERIRAMAKVFLAYEAGELPQGFHEPLRHMKRLGRTIGHAITLHIMDNDGEVDAKLLEWFITCFSVRGFTEETGGDEVVEEYRVDRAVTVDAAGIMILAPAEVVARLQTQPWPWAQQFLGGKAWAEAFGRYAPGGQSLPVLQNRYAADGTTIVARWNELAAWVEAQRSAEHA